MLPTPRLDLGPDERVEMYRAYAARAEMTVEACQGGGVFESTCYVHEHGLVLGEGTLRVVNHAEDLAPLVYESSATVRHADAARRAHRVAWWAEVAMWVASTAALALLVERDSQADPFQGRPGITTIDRWSAGGLALGALVGLIVHVRASHEEDRERAAAYAAFDDDLRSRLGLCMVHNVLGPCDHGFLIAPRRPE